MGLIDTIREQVPFMGSEPEADLSAADFENFDPSGDEGDGDDSESGEGGDEEQQDGGDSGEGNGEEDKEQNDGDGGSGGSDDGEEGDDQDGDGGDGEGEEGDEGDSGSEGDGGDGEGEESDEGDSGSEGEPENGGDGQGGDGDTEDSMNLSEEEREDLKEKMDEASAERDMGDWHGAEGDYTTPSQFVQKYFEDLENERAEPETQIDQRKRDRDDRSESLKPSVNAQQVAKEYDKRFADEIAEAFRKIKTREAPKPAEYGQRLNMRGVVRRRAGDPTEERLYLEMDKAEAGDRCITVVLDGSGSMDDLEIKLALKALADACEQIGDRLAATTYDTVSSYNNSIRTHLVTAPAEDFQDEHLNSFQAGGYTPTASGILDGRAIADITPNSEDVLIVVTDGIANVDTNETSYSHSDYKNPAMKEARQQVNSAVAEGKRVIGLGVGEHIDDDAMEEIFGPSFVRADMDEMAEALVEIYREQMKTEDH